MAVFGVLLVSHSEWFMKGALSCLNSWYRSFMLINIMINSGFIMSLIMCMLKKPWLITSQNHALTWMRVVHRFRLLLSYQALMTRPPWTSSEWVFRADHMKKQETNEWAEHVHVFLIAIIPYDRDWRMRNPDPHWSILKHLTSKSP